MKFLKENWVWIVVPILLFVAAVVALIVLGDSDPLGNHGYNL
ncbi:MAG: ABC-type dipeptide/oligopeptide/nickel transport system permease subunit [Planctomycetota bacterium]|jgi:ABC-type dipeptide/oligopeptide/nickel transport system permease subunit